MYYNIGADLKNVRSCTVHTFLDRSFFFSSEILHLFSFLLVHLGFTMPFKLQSVNRATTQLARYSSTRFLHGTLRSFNGTVRCVSCTVRFVYWKERFVYWTVRFVSCMVRFVSWTVRYASCTVRLVSWTVRNASCTVRLVFCTERFLFLRHDLLNGMQISRRSLLGFLLICSCFLIVRF